MLNKEEREKLKDLIYREIRNQLDFVLGDIDMDNDSRDEVAVVSAGDIINRMAIEYIITKR